LKLETGRERTMDFREADHRYAEQLRQYDAGASSPADFAEEHQKREPFGSNVSVDAIKNTRTG
jgi:hypothetical protein